MFADPAILTYATVSKSLPRIGGDADQSIYFLNDGTAQYQLLLSHQYKKRLRFAAQLRRTLNVTDPLVPANYIAVSSSASFVLDVPAAGQLVTDAQSLGECLRDFMTDSKILALAGGQT